MAHPFSYEGKRVVITGATTGVGAALVGVLRELDAAHVTTVDRKPTDAGDTHIDADLSTSAGVQAVLGAVEGQVHALFNNAGVANNLGAAAVIGVNVLALRDLSAGLLDRISEGGSITNTASMAGNRWPERQAQITELLGIDDWDKALAFLDGHPELIADPYSFSKECAQVQTMLSSRATGKRGVRTNSVCPGLIATPLMTDFRATMGEKVIDWTESQSGRMAQPVEIASALAFAGSGAASYMNGTNMLVDGGFSAAMTTGQIDFSGLA